MPRSRSDNESGSLGIGNAWLALFFVVAFAAPPLPVAFGNSGPHPALAIAVLGIGAGFLRFGDWRFRRDALSAVFVVFFTILTISLAPAALYSGPDLAAQSLARVLLAGIAIYVFFYVSAGPGRAGSVSLSLVHWAAIASAAFACIDFFLLCTIHMHLR